MRLGVPGAGSGSLEFLNSGEAKAWRDIWPAGHGIGAVTEIGPTAAVVDRLAAEYERARERLAALG
jgi:nitronate monooxygenase